MGHSLMAVKLPPRPAESRFGSNLPLVPLPRVPAWRRSRRGSTAACHGTQGRRGWLRSGMRHELGDGSCRATTQTERRRNKPIGAGNETCSGLSAPGKGAAKRQGVAGSAVAPPDIRPRRSSGETVEAAAQRLDASAPKGFASRLD